MTPTLESLARQLSAVVAWRSIEGLAWTTPDGSKTGRINRNLPTFMQPPASAILDLSDLVTGAALVVVAREVSGWPEAVACRLGGEWAVHESAESFASWCEYANNYNDHEADERWPRYATEIEALAAVILRGGE